MRKKPRLNLLGASFFVPKLTRNLDLSGEVAATSYREATHRFDHVATLGSIVMERHNRQVGIACGGLSASPH
jgi:hypothetical protein